MSKNDIDLERIRRENRGCLLMGLAAVIALFAAVSFFRYHSFNEIQEEINNLTPLVSTDTECDMLRDAQLALDMGNTSVAHRRIKALSDYLKENP